MLARCFLIFFVIFSGVLAPSFVFAKDDICLCYCQTGEGAQLVSKSKENPNECAQECDAFDLTFLGCYTEKQEDNLPQNNELCWTKEECISDEVPVSVDRNGDVVSTAPSVWGGQESFCVEGEGYCYNPFGAVSEYSGSTTVSLGVMIGQLDEAAELGQYIEAVYNFLIVAGSLFAVLLMMVAGLLRALARGKQEMIGRSNALIQSALVGLVLLLGSYFIVRLIDPRLTDFSLFRVPKIKSVIFLQEGTSCGNLLKLQEDGKLEITLSATPKKECGFQSTIESLTINGGESLTVGLEAGDTCNWTQCENPYEACVATNQTETGFDCISCSEIYETGDGVISSVEAANGVAPSALTCSRALTSFWKSEAVAHDEYAACAYYDAGLADFFSNDACFEVVYPGSDDYPNQKTIDCAALREYAREQGSESCRMYDLVLGRSGDDENGYTYAELESLNGAKNDFRIFSDVCKQDPCGVSWPTGSGCVPLIEDRTGGWCSSKGITSIINQTFACQVLGSATTRVNCFDPVQATQWNVLNSLAPILDPNNASQKAELIKLREAVVPTDVNGNRTTDVNW